MTSAEFTVIGYCVQLAIFFSARLNYSSLFFFSSARRVYIFRVRKRRWHEITHHTRTRVFRTLLLFFFFFSITRRFLFHLHAYNGKLRDNPVVVPGTVFAHRPRDVRRSAKTARYRKKKKTEKFDTDLLRLSRHNAVLCIVYTVHMPIFFSLQIVSNIGSLLLTLYNMFRRIRRSRVLRSCEITVSSRWPSLLMSKQQMCAPHPFSGIQWTFS